MTYVENAEHAAVLRHLIEPRERGAGLSTSEWAAIERAIEVLDPPDDLSCVCRLCGCEHRQRI